MVLSPTTTNVRSMFDDIASGYDLTNTILSLGIHHIWKRTFIKQIYAQQFESVLDLCTGTGDLLPLLHKRFGNARGLDFSPQMLKVAKAKYGTRYHLFQGDALHLCLKSNSQDLVTIAFGVRNFVDLDCGLQEVYRVLKPGGRLLILEFGQPHNKLWERLFSIYSKILIPIIGAVLTGHFSAYKYLPETASHFICGKKFVDKLMAIGFEQCVFTGLTGGVAYMYSACKPRVF